MKKFLFLRFSRSLFFSGTLLLAAGFTAAAQDQAPPQLRSFLGWMPMQPVTAGGRLVLDMHRFYFAKPGAGDEVVLPDDLPGRFKAQFDKNQFALAVQLEKDATGLVEIPVQVFERGSTDAVDIGRKDTAMVVSSEEQTSKPVLEGVLLIGVQPADGYTFTYRATNPNVKKVSVAGQFNGWNSESHPLEQTGPGFYELFVRVPAG